MALGLRLAALPVRFHKLFAIRISTYRGDPQRGGILGNGLLQSWSDGEIIVKTQMLPIVSLAAVLGAATAHGHHSASAAFTEDSIENEHE
jgi:hypothetical protein